MTETSNPTLTRRNYVALSVSVLASGVCLLYAAYYYFRMVSIGWAQGRGKTVMEDCMEFFYFGILYFGPLELFALIAALFSGPARKRCVVLAFAYPALLVLYIALYECLF